MSTRCSDTTNGRHSAVECRNVGMCVVRRSLQVSKNVKRLGCATCISRRRAACVEAVVNASRTHSLDAHRSWLYLSTVVQRCVIIRAGYLTRLGFPCVSVLKFPISQFPSLNFVPQFPVARVCVWHISIPFIADSTSVVRITLTEKPHEISF